MGRLVFAAADLKRIIDHTLANPQAEKTVDYDAETGNPITKPVEAPAVILVHDDGVYLLSNGTPGDIANPETNSPRRYVAYAQGCNPEKDGDCWDRSRDLVGGDDFSDVLPWANTIKAHLDRGATHIVIGLNARSVTLTAKYPRRRAA